MTDATEMIVIIGGVATIAFVPWYFFGEREATAAGVIENGAQEIRNTEND